jgi:hypothetical protein
MEHRIQEEYQKHRNIPLTDDCIKSDLLSEIRRVQRDQIALWIFIRRTVTCGATNSVH